MAVFPELPYSCQRKQRERWPEWSEVGTLLDRTGDFLSQNCKIYLFLTASGNSLSCFVVLKFSTSNLSQMEKEYNIPFYFFLEVLRYSLS